jgi:hypothetical protein
MPHILADLGEHQPSINLPEKPYISNFPETLRPWALSQVAKTTICLRRHSSECPQIVCDIVLSPQVIHQGTRLNSRGTQIDNLAATAQRCAVPIHAVASAGDPEVMLFIPVEVARSHMAFLAPWGWVVCGQAVTVDVDVMDVVMVWVGVGAGHLC